MEIHSCWFARPDGSSGAGAIHGTGHTKRVRSHALAIADELEFSEWERQAIECAACWHDIGRTNDGSDYYHGAKSALITAYLINSTIAWPMASPISQ